MIAKKLILILLLGTKMYGCARFLTDQWEKEMQQSEPRSGRMDWWAPQNEFAADHLRKCAAASKEKEQALKESPATAEYKNAQVQVSADTADCLDQSTMNKLLHLTAAAGKLQAVQYLITKGAPVNARDEDTWTPLMKATEGNHLAVVKALLDAGADMDAYSDYCRICDAAIYGDYPPNWRGPTERRTPVPHKCREVTSALELAKSGNHAEIKNLFVEYKSRNKKTNG
jgi:hypothetical protein